MPGFSKPYLIWKPWIESKSTTHVSSTISKQIPQACYPHSLMAWDSKSSRRRQNSSAATIASPPAVLNHNGNSKPRYPPKSAHVADPSLQPFLNPAFDAASYLNSTLPALQTPASRMTGRDGDREAVPLTELSLQTQTLLSNLSAHTSRLATTLTQLTDEILRSGSRLAYEVEVLRGETIGLSETLTEGLHEDVIKFVPGGLEKELAGRQTQGARRPLSVVTTPKTPVQQGFDQDPTIVDPPYITQLRTLTLVRSRLDSVIKTFGDAMAWTFPPSEVSVTSSFLSVSAPEPGSGSDVHSTEEKGQQVSKALRQEIADLLIADDEDPVNGIESAAKRVEELKELAIVWSGTAEEKARAKFVDALARLVEERHRELVEEAESDGKLSVRVAALQHENRDSGAEPDQESSGYGFISRLQQLRGGS